MSGVCVCAHVRLGLSGWRIPSSWPCFPISMHCLLSRKGVFPPKICLLILEKEEGGGGRGGRGAGEREREREKHQLFLPYMP